ncbi:MAG TPA: hypothetical protein VIV06_11185, partial [Candidatus Limnocylindrales bacterium]
MQDALARPLAPLERSLRSAEPIDLGLTLAPLRHGLGDPTMVVRAGAIWRATRTPDGPATLSIQQVRDAIELSAWGPGAAWAIESAPSLVGMDDDPRALRPMHPIVREL